MIVHEISHLQGENVFELYFKGKGSQLLFFFKIEVGILNLFPIKKK